VRFSRSDSVLYRSGAMIALGTRRRTNAMLASLADPLLACPWSGRETLRASPSLDSQ
jgi:hypothetical protein